MSVSPQQQRADHLALAEQWRQRAEQSTDPREIDLAMRAAEKHDQRARKE